MSEIQITVKEGSIEHCIHEYRKSGRLCFNILKPGYDTPFSIIRDNSLDETLLDSTYGIEKPKPISKPVTAEMVKEAVIKAMDRLCFGSKEMIADEVVKKLELKEGV